MSPDAPLRQGLDGILPKRATYFDLVGEWSSSSGVSARAELGRRFTPNVGGLVWGEWRPGNLTTGAGVRVTW